MKSNQTSPNIGPSRSERVRVALVEDQRDLLDSWSNLIDSFPEFSCVNKCASGEEALRVLPATKPEIVLMDIFMVRMSGIECTARLKALLPNCRIIILTAANDDELVFLALKAGADGYLLKRIEPEALRLALQDVLKGGAPMTAEIARLVIKSFQQKPPPGGDVSSLSAREEEILVLLSKGYSNKEIADRLNINIETVRSHLRHAYEKLHVRSRAEAVGRYMSSQITEKK